MSVGNLAFLALVIVAFSLFFVVLFTTYVIVNLPERKPKAPPSSSVQDPDDAARKAA